ncbi:hypothetical protein C8J57DRAFT_1226259 [Mycena rebaudengoi]|nr:hypothetical protein C8J57DRAFT_1226259 [Mycena rebaudengoi]
MPLPFGPLQATEPLSTSAQAIVPRVDGTLCSGLLFPKLMIGPVNEDIWRLWSQHYDLDVWSMKRAQILALMLVSKAAYTVFQPYMYRYVNLVTRNRALCFLATLQTRQSLKGHLHFIQFTFDLRPLISFDLNVKDHHTQFWDSLRNLLPCLHSLVDLAFTFMDNDGAFLERLVSQADLERTLPPSIKTLHLKRLYTQSIPEDPFSVSGPWTLNPSGWAESLSKLSAIHTLIITTPCYIIWPPTETRLSELLLEWTSHMGRSSLREILLNCGFIDEGYSTLLYEIERRREKEKEKVYEDELEELEQEGELEEISWALKGGEDVEGANGIRVRWVSSNGRDWKVSGDISRTGKGASYLFGADGDEWRTQWVHEKKPAARYRDEANATLDYLCGLDSEEEEDSDDDD